MQNGNKINLFKQLKDDYKLSKKPYIFKTTHGGYLCMEGIGEPGGRQFQKSVECLYSMAYTVKMMRKSKGLEDYVVCKLEAFWPNYNKNNRSSEKILPPKQCPWRLMIRTPDNVNNGDLKQAAAALLSKGKSKQVEEVKLERGSDGLCVQMLHIGPYENEEDTLQIMKTHINEGGYTHTLGYREIYISDPRRIETSRLKTVLRLPITISPT